MMSEPTDERCQTPASGRGLRSAALVVLLLLPGLAIGQTAREIETLFWESVECGRASEVQVYLEQYPTGAYVAVARACLEGQLGLDRAARVLVQQGLAAVGQEPGPADGLFGGEGSRTREALRAWQAAKGLAATGYMTGAQAETLMALGREAVAAAEAERQAEEQGQAEAERQRVEAERQQVEEAERRRKAAADDAAYAEAERANTAESYGGYLARYPTGRHAEEARERAERPRELRNSIGMEFVLIEPGTFQMGSPADESGRDEDETLHTVTISQPFYLGKYEVTQGQWQAVMGNNPSYYSACGSNCPVGVSWEDVQAFLVALNRKEGVNVYRLPTEAEWEYAARAGTQTAYHFGNSENLLEQYDWYRGNTSFFFNRQPRQVGGKRPNAWGLYDMHGNVPELVSDWYGPYPRGPVTDPRGPSTGTKRVLRSGNWFFSEAHRCRAANRMLYDGRSADDGFRLARTP